MSEDIQVSVIVPSYDHEVFVASAVRSVLEQTAAAFEVIAIDDGSNDSSVARLEEIEDSRLVVVRQENCGLSRTLNRGLELARGRWVKMLPSDDLLEPGALAAQVQQADASGSAVVFCLPTVVDAADQPLGEPGPQAWFDLPASDSAEILRAMVPRNPLCAPGALFDRELAVRVGGFDPSLRVAQDYDLWFRLLQAGTGRLVPERRVRVRWHGGNQSAQATEATEAERAYALVGALVRRGMQWWTDRFQSRVALAAALVASGLREARPFARASLVSARTAGESVGSHPELTSLLQEAPELARPGDWGGLPAGTRGWE
ncbi:MAG: glycosyltransferase [Candidatus Binatia bacterium]|nr:glycosyltransferase [Candidatus Binatia bacterium]